ncbi:uncharacterized protein BT62DRAFT_1007312 [Guyanagaster necrorhizus]|uniref:DUF6533 domain-containing protein n=1 Tax=Guyanagaster necrorhizus TaxID=856835 RepID=A0A9P8ASJ5_9AGAR|nr:uncharacterized protein BT62DRAFT_1007312 [Guyanagaster necrorhizus MCA 3950]KAG7444937.1 hypothetical protein BT62DRAFT_1007312 [Guyanagaster necrorhizus MCA 3950]
MATGGLDLAGFSQARAERNAYLACAALIVYEYFLQLDAEVVFFWQQRWSLAKALFLWSRYYGLAFNVFVGTLDLRGMNGRYSPPDSIYAASAFYESVRIDKDLLKRWHPSNFYRCNTFFHWQNTGASLQVITSHVILELRLYAMYQSSRYILCLFVFLTFGEALAMGLVFGIPNKNLVGTNEPFPELFICADADPLDGSHWVVYYWMSILIIESTLFSLALWKAWQHRPSAQGSKLMQQLTRDSAMYFAVLFCIYLVNLIMWVRNRITLDELMTAFSFVISSIFANRLVISVRSNHYRAIRPELDTYMMSGIKFHTVQMKTKGTTTTGEFTTDYTTTGTDSSTDTELMDLRTFHQNNKFNHVVGV